VFAAGWTVGLALGWRRLGAMFAPTKCERAVRGLSRDACNASRLL